VRKTISILFALALVLSFSLVATTPVAAAERHVPVPYATIQDAINAAIPGDTIVVAAGTYTYGATLVINKPVTLRGSTRDDTLVQFDAAVNTAVRVEADNVTIERIHLRSQASSTSGDVYVIDIPFKAWGPDPAMPEEFYQNFTLKDAKIEGARRSLWIHMENLTIENTQFIYNGNRQAIQIRALLGTTRICGNSFNGAADARAAIILEAGGTLWPLGGDVEISGNTVTRFSQFTLLNMGSMPELTDLLIKDNVIDHQDRGGSSIIFFAPVDFSGYNSIEIIDNTFTNPNSERLAVYVDYSYGGTGVPGNGQIKTGCNTFGVATPWGKVDDTVHPDVPVGFSASAPVWMSLAAFDVTCETLPVPDCVDTATGSGIACLTTADGTIVQLVAVAAPSLPSVSFPHGMFSFEITGLAIGETVSLTINLPAPVPVGTVWWKYDNGRWHSLPNLSDDGDSIMIIQLTDGGTGDSDSIPGQITDPGGPGSPMTVGWDGSPVSRASVLTPWLVLLAVVAAGLGLLIWRRLSAES
jgi:hypothetical protein